MLLAQLDNLGGAHWETIVANGILAVLLAIAYSIREWANGKKMGRMENKIDGNTALTATNLVSSGNLPRAAPCIPAVAKAMSERASAGCQSAVDYATNATAVAHETMAREGIPIQTQELLVSKLHTMLIDTRNQAEETKIKEERHAQNNAAWVKQLNEAMEAMKDEIAKLKAANHPG